MCENVDWINLVHKIGTKDGHSVYQRTSLFWVITRRVVVISYLRFGTTYRSHPQVIKSGGWDPIGCPETSVRSYHYSPRNNSDEQGSQLLRSGSQKSRIQLIR